MVNATSQKSKYRPFLAEIKKLARNNNYVEVGKIMKAKYPDVFAGSSDYNAKIIGQICREYHSTNTLTPRLPTVETPNENIHWREIVKVTQDIQELSARASHESNRINTEITIDKPVCLVFLSDLHLGAIGTDYEQFKRVTEDIINTEGLYVILGGDEVNFAVKMRGITEIREDLISPELQHRLLESWIKDIGHKVIASCSGNHDAWRTTNTTGLNPFKELFKSVAPYADGICHADFKINNEVYKLAFSHMFKGHSQWNPIHAGVKYATMKGQDREIVMSGHTHRAAHGMLNVGGKKRLVINSGTLQNTSQYGRRFFGISTLPFYPCAILSHDSHDFMGCDSIKWYLDNFKY